MDLLFIPTCFTIKSRNFSSKKEAIMQAQKLSISLPAHYADFLNAYQEKHQYKTRSEVIQEALCLLQQKQLASQYKEANQEIDEAWDITANDGLDADETW